jgi:hypothetical protein
LIVILLIPDFIQFSYHKDQANETITTKKVLDFISRCGKQV